MHHVRLSRDRLHMDHESRGLTATKSKHVSDLQCLPLSESLLHHASHSYLAGLPASHLLDQTRNEGASTKSVLSDVLDLQSLPSTTPNPKTNSAESPMAGPANRSAGLCALCHYCIVEMKTGQEDEAMCMAILEADSHLRGSGSPGELVTAEPLQGRIGQPARMG